MESMYPQTEDSEESREGTAAHELGEKLVRAAARAGFGTLQVEQMVGTEAENGVIFTEEMFDAAKVYADDVREIMMKICAFNPAIESRVGAKVINDECWGTPDCTLHDAKNRTIFIWDFKFGHRLVDAFENWQLLEYAAGLYQPGRDDRFVLTIVQPRGYHRDGPVRRWIVSAAELESYIQTAVEFEAAALRGDGDCTPTPNGCRDCQGRHACEALQVVGYSIADMARKPIPLELDPVAMGVERRMLGQAFELLKARIEGLDVQIETFIRKGTAVPGWILEPQSGRVKWTESNESVFALGEMLGIDFRKNEPITPTQAKKEAQKIGVDEAVINAYSGTSPSGVKLVESSQTRVATVFGKKGA